MSVVFILNERICFNPQDKLLSSADSQHLTVMLNVPVSRCLELLLKHRYATVSQKEFYSYVWGEKGDAVPPGTLYQNIALLRKSLRTFFNDDKIVLTIPREGFSLSKDISIREENRSATSADDNNVDSAEHEISAHSLPESAPKQSVTTKVHTIDKIMYTAILLLAGLLTTQLFFAKQDFLKHFPDNYFFLENISGCEIYINNSRSNLNKIKNALIESGINCKVRKRLYISSYLNSTHISMLSCIDNNDMHSGTDCITYNVNPELPQ